jgi:ferredoxin-NADP reductase
MMTVPSQLDQPARTTVPSQLVRLAAKTPLADGVVALTLVRAGGGVLPPWEPGAHVDLHLAPGLIRPYSLCGDPADRDQWRVAVLREPAGSGGSDFVHRALTPGTELTVTGPRNHFRLAGADRYLFIAGGIGITPILPMLAEAGRRGRPWRLLYGGRRRTSMAFLADLTAWGDHVTIWPQDECGLLDLDTVLGVPRPGTAVYCCGPGPLLAAAEAHCAAWPPGTLHVERFRPAEPSPAGLSPAGLSPAGLSPAGPTAATGPGAGGDTPFEVELASSGRVIAVPGATSVLTALRGAGLELLSSCEEGTCGTCETGVFGGVPDHRDSVLEPAERAAGDIMMICVSRARTPRLVLDL